jgi:hypothetical protein
LKRNTFGYAVRKFEFILNPLADMKKLTFYYQKRRDGGLRTGVELDGERILENFEPGSLPQDSALLWFVDVRYSGEGIPDQPEAVRQWLLQRSDKIRMALRELSAELTAGMDNDWPLKKEVPAANGVEMAIYCSAMRRVNGREISTILSNLEQHWPNILQTFASYEHPITI